MKKTVFIYYSIFFLILPFLLRFIDGIVSIYSIGILANFIIIFLVLRNNEDLHLFKYNRKLIIPTLLTELSLFAGAVVAAFISFHFVGFPSNTKSESSIFLILWILLNVATEELFFRLKVQQNLLRHFTPRQSITVQTVLFSLAHWSGGLQAMITALFAGPALGYVTYRTKSIWPAIISHLIYNLIVILI